MNNYNHIVYQLFFEVVERIARFSLNLDKIKNEYYNEEDLVVRDKITFIESFEDCLAKCFQISISYFKLIKSDTISPDTALTNLEQILKAINDLHIEHLGHLPRPSEPVELRRFSRVIKKQIFHLGTDQRDEWPPISIYISEKLGEVSYATDPLQNFKNDELNALILNCNAHFPDAPIEDFKTSSQDSTANSFHITISSIDATNPCHWPTLLHEVSHTLMQGKFFSTGDIENDFIEYLKGQDALESFTTLQKKLQINVRSWLTECWCDLFACASIGPSFYFSQYHSFLNNFSCNDNKLYPSYLFRINLIEKILQHRFEKTVKEEKVDNLLTSSQKIIEILEKNHLRSYFKNPYVRKLFYLFKEFFLSHLFKSGDGQGLVLADTTLNEKFQKTVRYVNQISPERITTLTKCLEEGFPIPSYVESTEPYIEKPTSVQEILFASWVYRNTTLQERILKELSAIADSDDANSISQCKLLMKETICKMLLRFDQSLLSSIQVSEYFDALMDKEDMNTQPVAGKAELDRRFDDRNLLVDWEILNCLRTESIRVIPIISLKHQQGSTSLDIRLGSTFELYLPNQFGILDFAESESVGKITKGAQRNNLDFPDSIVINPGQFILGHSMEYIKLPESISADLEGRSSFARLGIEIHMTAGFIDPGFEGVLTLEIFNAGPSAVRLYPGMRIGQLRFTKTNAPVKSYSSRNSAKYAGLLEYHSSKQNKDYEVFLFRKLKSDK